MNAPRTKTPWFRSPSLLGVSSMLWALACGSSQQSGEPAASPEAPSAETTEAAGGEAPSAEAAPTGSEGRTLDVPLQAKSGSSLSGDAKLTETPEGVKVELTIEHAPPGEHGAHVHEKGDCSAPDGSSAGGHFNPSSHPHALPASDPRHLGDLGNIEVGAPGANLKDGDPNSFVGKAIIVHEKKDDGGQPTGNAGGRIGCGEIKSS
jgi:Cu-Zn family superoxide dismutase